MRVPTYLFLVLAITCLLPSGGAARLQDPRQEAHGYLSKAGFTSAELQQLEAGQVLSRAVTTTAGEGEILTAGAVKVRAPRDRVLAYYRQMISFVDGEVTLAFGRFSTPPALPDVKSLSFEQRDIEDLKRCRPGDCDVRLSGTGIESLRSAIDWNAADHVDRVNEFIRKAAVSYVTAYQKRGDAALITYDDRSKPVSLAEQWRGILAGSTHFHEYSSELKAYLENYPQRTPPGASDVLYWSKENFGFKPIVSIVHGVLYEPPAKTDRAFVVQKQIYANHYYDGSLAVGTLLSTTDNGAPATYLLYANRSRGDMLRGGFGGLKRATAESQARKATLDTLGAIKRALER